MNLEKYLSVTPEIQAALAEGKPVVALESTILSHGMPYPQNLDFGRKVEQIIRDEGCVPATIAILDGKMKVGLNEEELERMCHADGVGKVSRRDLATYLATGMPGATTVTTTMIVAVTVESAFSPPAASAACIAARRPRWTFPPTCRSWQTPLSASSVRARRAFSTSA